MANFTFDATEQEIALRLIAALAIGGVIGLERSYHSRPAGFRTHALVCMSTALLMLITVYDAKWFPEISGGRIALDPTRMAQGIMTGIGFLGAGSILRQGLTIHGLTTAASIWTTAAIGILVGIGFYFPAVFGALLTFATLSTLSWIERRLPSKTFANLVVRFARDKTLPEDQLRKLLVEHGFTITQMQYRLHSDGQSFEYHMVIRTQDEQATRKLNATLNGMPTVVAFRVSPTGN